MSLLKIISIIALNIIVIKSNFLEVGSNYKPKFERTNILNKGIWLKSKFKESETTKLGDFIFRPNSLDVDNLVQGTFNAFDDNSVNNNSPFFNFGERSKRSYDELKKDSFTENNIDESSLVKSKIIAKLKPASVFNDYPFEIAMLLSHSGIELVKANGSVYTGNVEENNDTLTKESVNNTSINIGTLIKDTEDLKDIYNVTSSNDSLYVPKRSRQSDYEKELIKKVEFTEELKTTTDKYVTPKLDRGVFDKSESNWQSNAPVSNVNTYQVVSKLEEPKKIKPMTERGLVKVLSMLTKTFKKIMRQHNDIKDVHRRIHDMNTDFLRNIVIITEKFKDFDEKYKNLLSFNKRIKTLEEKFKAKERHVKNKEKELAQNLLEFESQQKKFLNQQRQFYNIQKLMLSQNEKINARQNMIARTQSEISHRQNNFARILKKAKQIYLDKHPAAVAKITSIFAKIKNTTEMTTEYAEVSSSSTVSPVTDSVKINLFSIPSETRIENQDDLLLNEKDDQSIDDLVYKYYFNNTFIDNLMKTNFLSSFIPIQEQSEPRFFKSKRDKNAELETTVLLPVKKSTDEELSEGKSLNRERRWIRHRLHKKTRKNHRQSKNDNIIDDEKVIKKYNNLIDGPVKPARVSNGSLQKSEPFLSMATNFCNGIGQNSTTQILNWCVEKALRRLQNLGDMKMPTPPPQANQTSFGNDQANDSATAKQTEKSVTIVPTAYITSSTVKAGLSHTYNMFFPDNDELESNLKQYGVAPDTEGNVYFDGSLHASEMITGPHSEGSDVLPGMDSNSKIDEIDPMTLDTQAMRRAFIDRIKYENMLKTMSRITP